MRYAIHDFVDVVIDEELDQMLIPSIEFQLGGFGRANTARRPGVPGLAIRPYRAWRRPSGTSVFAFNDMYSDRRTYLDEPTHLLATVRGEGGFEVFTDEYVLVLLYIQLLLAQQDVTLVHAAGLVDDQGRTLLVAGGGGAGKTALIGEMVRGGGWRLLGDDLICLSAEGRCYSFLRHFVLKAYHRTVFPHAFGGGPWRRVALGRAIDILRANVPLVGLTKSVLGALGLRERVTRRIPTGTTDQRAVPIAELFGRDRIASGGDLEHAIFLDRYDGSSPVWSPISREQLAQRLFSIVHHEISSSLRPLLALASVDLVDAPAYFARAASIAERALEGRSLEQLSMPRGATPADLAMAVIDKVGIAA